MIKILSNWFVYCENHQIQNQYNDFLQEYHELMNQLIFDYYMKEKLNSKFNWFKMILIMIWN